jgi:hypothetical protein
MDGTRHVRDGRRGDEGEKDGGMMIERMNMKIDDGSRRSHQHDRMWTPTDRHVMLLFFS